MKKIVVGREVVKWVAQQTQEAGDFGCAHAIGLEEHGRLIAGVVYCQYNGPNVVCHIASDRTKRWMTRQYLWTIFDYPFNQVGVKRVTVCIGEGNKESINFVERLGFKLEAELGPDSHPSGRTFIYTMRKPQGQRWLNLRNTHEERMAA